MRVGLVPVVLLGPARPVPASSPPEQVAARGGRVAWTRRPMTLSRTTIRPKPITRPRTGELNSGNEHLRREVAPLHGVGAGRRPGCADETADERVAAGAGDRQRPGDQVPGDGAARAPRPEPWSRCPESGSSWTMPLPIVLATATPKMSAPTKLAEAERKMACSGLSARVETRGGDGVGGVVEAVDVVEQRRPGRRWRSIPGVALSDKPALPSRSGIGSGRRPPPERLSGRARRCR